MPSRQAGRCCFPTQRLRTCTDHHGQRRSGKHEFTKNEIGRIVIHFTDEDVAVPEAAAVVERILNRNHPMHDFAMTVPLAQLQVAQQTRRTFDLVLIVHRGHFVADRRIASMNIMLTIVTERIQEIGIRRALGASRHDILLQFLSETIVLSTSGGILGCLLGVIRGSHPVPVNPMAGCLYPVGHYHCPGVFLAGRHESSALRRRWQAAKMNPVDCLRYE